MHPATPAALALPEPLQSACDHDWPPMWETGPGSRHRCGHGTCRVLRANDGDILTYYDPAGTRIGWEPLPDYMKSWRDFWRPLLSGNDGHVDLDAIMRELADYDQVMTEVTKVYCEITGYRLSKPDTAAHHVLGEAAARHDEDIVDVLDQLAAQLDEAGHAEAARTARDLREDYGGWPDTTIPDSGIVLRVLSGGPFRAFLADPPGWSPADGLFCDDTLAIISGTSPVQLVCRAADLPGGGEDPQRRDLALRSLGGLCGDHGWRADVGESVITIISDQDAGMAAAAAAETLRLAGLGPVTLHDEDEDTAAGRHGVHIIDGTWPVQLYVPAGAAAAADLAGWLASSNEGWRAETAGDGWVTVIPAVLHE